MIDVQTIIPLQQKQSYLIVLFLLLTINVFAAVVVNKNPSTKLISWRFQDNNFKLELIQRLPDQTRAFFQARGFSRKVANDIALSCIFQAIGKNISKSKHVNPISYSLKDWELRVHNKLQSIKLKETWKKEWSTSDVNVAAKIAFTWATFPTQQTFASEGDYGWGMISFGLPPKSVFDLKVVWKDNNKTKSAWIHSITCPKDR